MDHNEVERRRRKNYGRHFDNLFQVLGTTNKTMSKIELLNFAKEYIEKNSTLIDTFSHVSQIDLKFNAIIEKVNNSFTISIDCFTWSILNVSENVENVIKYRSDDFIHTSILDYINPEDRLCFKQQLSENFSETTQSILDPLTGLIKTKGQALKANNIKNNRAFVTRLKNKEYENKYFYMQFIGIIQWQDDRAYFLSTVKNLDNVLIDAVQVPIISQSTSDTPESLSGMAVASNFLENIIDYDEDIAIDRFPEF